MALGIVCIVAAAHRSNLNRVFAARGHGPETFIRELCGIDGATPSSPVTHWLMSNANGDATELAILQAMTQGDLPPVPNDTVWGEDGVISAADAMAATDGGVFQVYSAAGDIEPLEHAQSILAGRSLQFIPDMED